MGSILVYSRAGTSLLPPFLDIDYSIYNRSFIEVDNVACLKIVSKPARSTVRCSSTNYVWESSCIPRRRGKFTDETTTSWSLCLRVSIAENSRSCKVIHRAGGSTTRQRTPIEQPCFLMKFGYEGSFASFVDRNRLDTKRFLRPFEND